MIARILLLRVLPRRILPVVTVVEALLFLRGIRNRSRTKVNPPAASRTAPPAAPAWPVPPTASPTAAPAWPVPPSAAPASTGPTSGPTTTASA